LLLRHIEWNYHTEFILSHTFLFY